jgi:hypothetical protein
MADPIDGDCVTEGWAPYRVVVIAEYGPRSEFALKCSSSERRESFSAGGYDRLIGRVEPAFRLGLRDPASTGEVEVDVRWKQWGDVAGGGLLASPAIVAMLDARTSLQRGSAQQDPYSIVDRVLPGNRAWLPRAAAPAERVAGLPAAAGDRKQGLADPLSALFDLVDLPAQPSEVTTANQYAASAQVVESAVSDLLCQAMAHPEYQRLRRTWHSLRAISLCQADSRLVELVVVSSSDEKEELQTALGRIDADLVVHEAPFEACSRDVERLVLLAGWAESHNTPVIATLGQSWVTSANPSSTPSRLRLAESARPLLDSIAVRDCARWLVLALNDVCDSEPMSGAIVRGGPSCVQPRNEASSWTFLPAGVAVAGLVVSSLVRDAEPFFSDARGTSELRGRALHELDAPDGPIAIATRRYCNEEVADDWGRLGICALVPARNRDRVRLVACPTACRPRNSGGDPGLVSSTLRDQILAGRVARLLMEAKLGHNSGQARSVLLERLQVAIGSLFPKAPPVGPFIDVADVGGDLVVEIRPRRYAQMTVDRLSMSVRLG